MGVSFFSLTRNPSKREAKVKLRQRWKHLYKVKLYGPFMITYKYKSLLFYFIHIPTRKNSLHRNIKQLPVSVFILIPSYHSVIKPATMGRSGGVIICLLILSMDIVAGILGIEAEIAQNKGKYLRVFVLECKEPVRQAYKLGLAAAVLLALAHAIANVLGGCKCICSRDEFVRSSANKQMAAGTLILSWIIVIVGFAMLIIGAMANSKSRVSCSLVHRHFLSIGGILCFVHGLFCVAYYVSADATRRE